MRAVFVQILSVFAIALGVGLLVAASSVFPAFPAFSTFPAVPAADMGQAFRSLEAWAHDARGYRDIAIALNGFGGGFLTLGILGLVVPWVNVLIYGWQRTGAAPGTPATAHRQGSKAEQGPRQRKPIAENQCLSCGRLIPAESSKCPNCGWTWESDNTEDA